VTLSPGKAKSNEPFLLEEVKLISHSNESNAGKIANDQKTIPPLLPWWTWVAPLFIANIGTWLSLWFKTDPGISLWYLPTALGIIMVYWWGPRALLGIYLNAALFAPLWDLPWKWSFLYALPETIEVGLSWLLFVKIMRRSAWLPDLATTARFLLFGSVLPAALANVYLVIQLFLLGNIARSNLWDNWIVLFSADVATHLALAVPALISFTKFMIEKGWAKADGEVISLPLLPDNRNTKVDVIFIGTVFISIFFMVILTSIHDYWIVYGVLMIILAIRYGVNIAVIASSWTGALALLLPPIMKNQLGLPTAAYSDVLIFNLDILFLCAVSLLIGRAISDLFNDITERKRTEEILQKSEERFYKAFHDSPAGLTITSLADGTFIDVNESFLNMFQYRREEVIGRTSVELNMLSPEERAKPIQQLRDQGRVTNFEIQLRAKSGRLLNVLFSTAQIELNGAACALTTTLDITERKRAEEKLRASEERLEILHEIDRALLSAHALHDLALNALVRIRRLIPCPRASVSLFDLDKKEASFLTADFDNKVEIPDTPITFEEFGQRVIDVLLENKPWISEDVLKDPQATELDERLSNDAGIQAWLTVPLMAQGQLIGALNLGRPAGNPFTRADADIAHDIANQLAIALQQANLYEALEKELAARKRLVSQLEANNAELERFTYTVSHDLRNPLVTIKGFLGMLNKDMQENRQDKIQTDFQRIASAADKMDELLADLLDLSRIGRVINPPEEVNLVKLTQDALELLDARIRSKNVTVNISPDLPVVHGDRVRLREALENLVVNAVKYMGAQPNPVIEIGARDDEGERVIFVKDNGIGIESKYYARIFNLFEKLNPAGEGTGIGLALVKRIIETHGGRIWIESEGLGKGSTFCFTIPDGEKVHRETSTHVDK